MVIKFKLLPRAYIKVGCHLRLTIGYLKATVVHIRVTLGHFRVTIGHYRITLGYRIDHYFSFDEQT